MNHRIIASTFASVVIIGFFCVLSLMLWEGQDRRRHSRRRTSGCVRPVVGYFYGSSASSARKDELQ